MWCIKLLAKILSLSPEQSMYLAIAVVAFLLYFLVYSGSSSNYSNSYTNSHSSYTNTNMNPNIGHEIPSPSGPNKNPYDQLIRNNDHSNNNWNAVLITTTQWASELHRPNQNNNSDFCSLGLDY